MQTISKWIRTNLIISLDNQDGADVPPTCADVDRVLRRVCSLSGGVLYMKGDSMSARYTLYRQGRLKQMRSEASDASDASKAQMELDLNLLVRDLDGLIATIQSAMADWSDLMPTSIQPNAGSEEDLMAMATAPMESLLRHRWLSRPLVDEIACEVSPVIRRTWTGRVRTVTDLVTLREAAVTFLGNAENRQHPRGAVPVHLGDAEARVLRDLFPDKVAMFSNLWRTAL
mmetsp:Transcript_6217/g.15763  ORF Transcript_6217/g.15763 Transcript_6217/m.15763 type:complete len:229 (-) Transcript_6217:86-772(-)